MALLGHGPRGAAMDALLRPLTGRAWLGVALLLLCLVLGLRSTVRARHLFGDTSVLDEDSWSSALVLVLGALSMQGQYIMGVEKIIYMIGRITNASAYVLIIRTSK